MNPIYMLLTIPFFLICMGIEWLHGRLKGKKYYRFNDTLTNLNIGIGSQIFSLIFKGMILGSFVWIADQWSFMSIPNTWWSWLLCLVIFDFIYYWAHRWSHEVNVLWGAHVVHHQSEDFNLGVALRQSWFNTVMAAFLFLPIPLMGFDPITFISVSAFVTLYQFWIHTEAIKRMPRWFEYIFNTPSHHRVHHARDPKYIDRNYAAVFILWDKLCGTFRTEEERPNYGITKQFASWNPTWANFHYYVEMWQLGKQVKGLGNKLKLIFARPGWRPAELGGYDAPPPVDPAEQKYDTDNMSMRVYVTVQFALIAAGLMAYIYHFEELSIFFKISLAGLLILCTMSCGAILENKRWIQVVEYVKLLLAVVCLNSLYFIWYFDWFFIMLAASSLAFLLLTTWFTISVKRMENRLKKQAAR